MNKVYGELNSNKIDNYVDLKFSKTHKRFIKNNTRYSCVSELAF